MKNLTIKKVALGLFLAGYAASSAFATQAETFNTINGNKPILQSRAGQNHQLTVDIIHADGSPFTGGTVRVGDKIHIKYRLADLDGDTDTATAGKVKSSLKIYGKTGGSWSLLATQPTVTSNYDPSDSELGELEFEINSDFIGKDKIGFKIKAETEFGVPTEGQWLTVGDIFGPGVPDHGNTEPTDPGSAGGPGDGNSSNGGGGGVTPGPIMPTSGKLGIFLIDSTGVIINTESYTKSNSTLIPTYGERYAAVVWNDLNSNDKLEPGETDYTSSFSFEWHVTGAGVPGNNNTPASTTALNGDGNRTGTNDTIFLGSRNGSAKHNTLYNGYSVAGIQGYQLQVKTN